MHTSFNLEKSSKGVNCSTADRLPKNQTNAAASGGTGWFKSSSQLEETRNWGGGFFCCDDNIEKYGLDWEDEMNPLLDTRVINHATHKWHNLSS